MRGLCHSCLASNVELSVVRGRILCAGCTPDGEQAAAGAGPAADKKR